MKKNFKESLIVGFTCLLALNAFAQKSYLTFNTGYGMKLSTQNIPDLYMYNYINDADFTTREQINLSLGKGIMAEGSYGYMFGKNIGAEIGFSYLKGGKTESKFTYLSGEIHNSLSAEMIRITPTIIISGEGEKFRPYGKLGLVTGFGTVNLEENSNLATVKELKTTKFRKGLAVGASAGLGIITTISGPFSFLCELNTVTLSYAPQMSEVTEFTRDGVNKMDELTLSQKETQFYDSMKFKTINPDEPRPALKQKLPFGSIGIKVGLKIDL